MLPQTSDSKFESVFNGLYTDWLLLCDGPFNQGVYIQGSFVRICVHVSNSTNIIDRWAYLRGGGG